MPQLVAIVLIGGLAWYAYRAFKREMERVGRETRKAEKKQGGKPLEKGPDGIYRPSDSDE